MLSFPEVVKNAYEFCYQRSYPALPMDSEVLEEIPNWKGWENLDLNINTKNGSIQKDSPYYKWLESLRIELNNQHLSYRRDE